MFISISTTAAPQLDLALMEPALPKREPSAKYLKEKDVCMGHFQYWNEQVKLTWSIVTVVTFCQPNMGGFLDSCSLSVTTS